MFYYLLSPHRLNQKLRVCIRKVELQTSISAVWRPQLSSFAIACYSSRYQAREPSHRRRPQLRPQPLNRRLRVVGGAEGSQQLGGKIRCGEEDRATVSQPRRFARFELGRGLLEVRRWSATEDKKIGWN